jgi:hypothetical protein
VTTPPERKTSKFTIAIYWIIVLIPLAWGVNETVNKSLPLLNASADPNADRDRADGKAAEKPQNNTRHNLDAKPTGSHRPGIKDGRSRTTAKNKADSVVHFTINGAVLLARSGDRRPLVAGVSEAGG